MSIVNVVVPQLSESVSEGTLIEWKFKVGDQVSVDEILVEIETDKVLLEVPSPSAGVITEILEQDGATVTPDQVLAKIDTEAKAEAKAEDTSKQSEPKEDAQSSKETTVESAKSDNSLAQKSGSKGDVASPAARNILAEKDMKASDVAGSGRDGRVTKADAQKASKGSSVSKPSAPMATNTEGRIEERIPMTRLRARVAERLIQSQQQNAILTTFNEVNMKPVMDLRNKYKESFEKEHGIKLGFMSFFVKAAVHGLKKYPILNASVDGNDIVYHGYFDIGVAVSSPRGLVVPVIRNADQLSFADIEKTIAEFGQKAKEGKLGLDELTGGTFTVSNGGVFGSMMSTPIINPPQSAILGIHATRERAVVENGEIVIRPMNYFALSYDHRIIDGREAVLGLVAMKEALEDPQRLLLNL
ncbi:2-oxoglutarate dehydrogenase complex dihydrolipoyllysine-residue succinyltransferase [Taylorella equigenitalis]|uniref:Dihydrolipoyllysine-residue succinyltransferase component of 2-oxoglutarate dehydrogenase complex n=1 Tax=Taylorella equigenitalis (strain MCE9) TaxID=937774 RepID=A0A654KIK1_TAYEM|nr:2-oxoglutarate dehydrogenase complex dihydrolipoyllysine-residue succinyltransferase [Taylorella equigenitalis]ADU92230.1 Dihydrolipoamide succinyltransferase component (E2) of 2-oxoglutarate dehydrogenase complex [Taylorella equigenitalis MCE9]WDU52485.1 2-oxoglutarate dehydrogenase complex dihydrolipoyllysine-residue succinyltransferase [Taylorella equigenitalis]WDU53991.1 2-oxoglutarate dehydrogenase complex dihydrolipoyllysine-residue succinyltransferase [Taylorella equigenitalis]WDU5697